MNTRFHFQRGAALLETALILPVLLGALYAVVWGVRVGVVTERSEEVVRYAGVLQQQQNPFIDYSLYTLYNNLGATSNVPTQPCVVPNENFVTGGSVASVPGATFSTAEFGAFFLPTSLTVACTTPARVALTTGYSRQFLMLTEAPVVSADVNASFSGLLPGAAALGTHTLSRSLAFFRSPDLSSLLHCTPQLSTVITASLDPSSDTSAPGVTLPLASLDTTPIGITTNCNSGAGAPVPIPSQPPFIPTPAPTPSAIATGKLPTPSPTATPTVAPTTAPTKAPTAAPTATPTAAPTKTPTPVPTPSAGGGSPTPKPTATPTAKPTATPTPKPSPTPTPKPTPTPTPKPSPTPKPTPTPTPTPKPTPTPTPTPAPTPTPTPQPPSGPVS